MGEKRKKKPSQRLAQPQKMCVFTGAGTKETAVNLPETLGNFILPGLSLISENKPRQGKTWGKKKGNKGDTEIM